MSGNGMRDENEIEIRRTADFILDSSILCLKPPPSSLHRPGHALVSGAVISSDICAVAGPIGQARLEPFGVTFIVIIFVSQSGIPAPV